MAGAFRPILITFAIPHESRDLLQCRLDRQCEIIHTGIGFESAAAKVKQALGSKPPKLVISGGFAGGLDPSLKVADLVADSTRSDAALLSRIPVNVRRGKLLSVAKPLETVAAKAAAFRETDAFAVDMETDAIAKACAAAAVPALFIRTISDAADDEIPLPFEASYDLRLQRPCPLGVCLALLRSPAKIPRFIEFLRDLKTARIALTSTLRGFLADYSGGA